jgi:mono/diheme cytochrome c family protein
MRPQNDDLSFLNQTLGLDRVGPIQRQWHRLSGIQIGGGDCGTCHTNRHALEESAAIDGARRFLPNSI